MAIQLEVPVICGIAVGATFIVIIAGVLLSRLYLRGKHKTIIATKTTREQRRRAHLSITDEDVMRMPGMRRMRRNSSLLIYGHLPGWAPVSSRESIAKKGLAPNPADIDPATGVPPWHVRIPRKLNKKAPAPIPAPTVRIPLAALSPITEKSTNNNVISPSLSAVASSDDIIKSSLTTNPKQEVYRPEGSPDSDISPGTSIMKPKPLFHGQQRSASHGTLIGSHTIINSDGNRDAVSDRTKIAPLQLAQVPRLTSLCSQRSGQVPNIPVPPLPFEMPARVRSQLMKSSSELSPRRMSDTSILSGNTPVFGEAAMKNFSNAETAFIPINISSPPTSILTTAGLGISNSSSPPWNFSRIDRAASPLNAPKAENNGLYLDTQRSFQCSVQNSLPRSASSGLSMSLLDQAGSKNPSNTTLSKALAVSHRGRPNPSKPASGQQKLCEISSSISPSPNTPNIFQIYDENIKAQRASTSILQAVSGNEKGLISPVKNPWTDRPISIATEDPFRWDPKIMQQPGKPSAMKNGTRQHKRQSCVRISNIPVIIPSRIPCEAEVASLPLKSSFPNLIPQQALDNRPPSSKFSPHLPNSIPLSQKYHRNRTTHYSPTFSMLAHYASSPSRSPTLHSPNSSSNSSTSAISTPTPSPLHPSHGKKAAAHHPNRRHAIFPETIPAIPRQGRGREKPAWPLLSSRIAPEDPPTEVEPPSPAFDARSFGKLEGEDGAPSLMFDFPNPPGLASSTFQTPLDQPPQSKPRGPRSPPPPLSTRISKSHSRAQRSKSKSRSRSRSPIKTDALMQSILSLRRMNSEIHRDQGDGGGEGERGAHRRYLSLGRESLVEEEEWPQRPRGTLGRGLVRKEVERREEERDRSMTAFDFGKVAPLSFGSGAGMEETKREKRGSLYDGDGCLKGEGDCVLGKLF